LGAVLALGAAPGARAEQATTKVAATDAAPSGGVSEVVVTSSRIVRNGYQAPTPTTVLGVEEIQRRAPINLADQLNQLPALAGSTRMNTSSVSAGTAGMNVLNLRNLGQTRTLVLLDGQRMPASNTSGFVDANVIPNALVQRVDIVTGGASAAWGSDAVGGVVNFILDKKFTGIKGELSGGMTTYGDDPNAKVYLAAGTGFANDRGHILFSAEEEFNNGIEGLGPRTWYVGAKEVPNPAYKLGNGQPFLLNRIHVGYTQAAPGAIVYSGPLTGLYFGPNGTPLQVVPGTITSNPFMVEGGWKTTDFGNGPQSLDPQTNRQSIFLRTSYDVTDNINVWGQFSYTNSDAFAGSSPQYNIGGLTISINNAFLPASVVAAMKANNITSLAVGSWNQAIGAIPFWSDHQIFRYNLGADGKFSTWGKEWTWDTFADINISNIKQRMYIPANARYTNAINAVMGPNGSIICASTVTNPTDGCQPLNILGTGVASQAGLAYVNGWATYDGQIQQSEFSGTLHGEPFSTWAGPVSVALGIEHRREAETGVGDPISAQNGWFEGNYKGLHGAFDVTEGFFEAAIPLAKDMFLAKSLDFDGAVRQTDYSTSGMATTWKVGGAWSPIEDIKFRVTESLDIRAGGLSDLFQNTTATASVQDPFLNNANTNIFQTTKGNPTIQPEQGRTTDLGVVFQPKFVPGLSFSADYWDINITDAINSLSASQEVNACFSGVTSLCQYVIRGATGPNGPAIGGQITQIIVTPINIAYAHARGLDLESSYRFPLSGVSHWLGGGPVARWLGEGQISLRGLVTHYLESVTNTGAAGALTISALGANNAIPYWRYLTEAVYTNGPLSASVTARGISDGLVGGANIQCATACPLFNPSFPTIDNNFEPGALYFDLSLSYKFKRELEGFFVINNVANAQPAAYPNTTSIGSEQMGVSALYYDVIGRSFRGGIRFHF
jgi:outer membrane receptor protein involved in Fe transport